MTNRSFSFRLHGGDNVQIKRYFVSFWNGVDLRYKLLKGPKIRISIAGIIISRVTYNIWTQFQYLREHKIVQTVALWSFAQFLSGKGRHAVFGTESCRSRCHWFSGCADWHGQIPFPGEKASGLRHSCRCDKVRVLVSLNTTYG